VTEIYFLKKSQSDASYFPIGLEKIFENLNWIQFEGSNLQEIHQCDLKPFGDNLTNLNLNNNKLEVIEADLFNFNTKLERIHLANNKIEHIDPSVFDHLINTLELLDLRFNTCGEKVGKSNEIESVQEIIDKVKGKSCYNEESVEVYQETSENYCLNFYN
jgi:Leucine-rich repeat (LRR) protein